MSLKMAERDLTTIEFARVIKMSARMVGYHLTRREWKIDGKFSPEKKEGRWFFPPKTELVLNPRSPNKGGRPFGSSKKLAQVKAEREIKLAEKNKNRLNIGTT